MIFDYDTIKFIWWLVIGLLLVGFALTDGFDMGVGILLPFIGKTDMERRVIINTIGPTWEGNQVWFVSAAAAIFAAWPLVYATAFSGLYEALLLALFALLFRPVGFDYRSKVQDIRWRNTWDWGLFAGGFVPILIFGVAFGNLLQGLPFYIDDTMRSTYTGTFFALLNPFAILCGLVSVAMIAMHGSIFLQIKTESNIQQRARKATSLFGIIFIVAFSIAGIWVAFGIDGYRLLSEGDSRNGLATLLNKVVVKEKGIWLVNYSEHSWTLIAPVVAYIGVMTALLFSTLGKPDRAFLGSCATLAGTILTAGFSMFPFILPSSTNPSSSLMIWDATSSHLTLTLLFGVVVIFLPIIIAYTFWVYRVMHGKVTEEQIKEDTHTAY